MDVLEFISKIADSQNRLLVSISNYGNLKMLNKWQKITIFLEKFPFFDERKLLILENWFWFVFLDFVFGQLSKLN